MKQTVEELLLQQHHREDEEPGGFDMDEFMAAVNEGNQRYSRGEANLRNEAVMKRIADGSLLNGRKKMHKSAGPAFE